MSILNRASDGLHSVLVVICKYLLHRKKASREEILGACAPKVLINDSKHVRQTLNTWTSLGLFMEADGIYTLAPDLPREALDPATGLAVLPRVARGIVLREANNRLFWESEGSLAADFTRAVSWALAQDAYTMPSGPHRDVEALELLQVHDAAKRIFQNDTRWPGLKAWAPFLGFGWTAKEGRTDLFFTDPTVAVRDSLSAVFQKDRELPASDFLSRLARLLPVLDGGTYRIKVEAALAPGYWQAQRGNEVSTSLSRALFRLHWEQSITLDQRADADKMILVGRNKDTMHTFSHVVAREEV